MPEPQNSGNSPRSSQNLQESQNGKSSKAFIWLTFERVAVIATIISLVSLLSLIIYVLDLRDEKKTLKEDNDLKNKEIATLNHKIDSLDYKNHSTYRKIKEEIYSDILALKKLKSKLSIDGEIFNSEEYNNQADKLLLKCGRLISYYIMNDSIIPLKSYHSIKTQNDQLYINYFGIIDTLITETNIKHY